MLLNPRKKRRSAAQKAATRKLVAFNRRGGSRKRRRNPVRSRARSYAAPARRRKSYRQKRGLAGISGGVMGALVPAAIGGAGALAVDVLFGYLPIPVQFKTGIFAPVVKIAGALGVGWLASNFTTKKTADQIMVGAITVTVYNLAKNWMQTAMPQIALGEYVSGYDNGGMGYVGAGQFQPDPLISTHIPDYETRGSAGLSEYVTDDIASHNNGW